MKMINIDKVTIILPINKRKLISRNSILENIQILNIQYEKKLIKT